MSELLTDLGYWLRDLFKVKRPFPLHSTVVPFCTTSTDLIDKDFGGSYLILKTVSITGNLKTGDSITITYRPYGSTALRSRTQNGLGSQYFNQKINYLKVTPNFSGERYGYVSVVYEGIHFDALSVGTSGMPLGIVDLVEAKGKLVTLSVMQIAQVIERKGGSASIDTYSTDAQVSETTSNEYVLKREFDLSTPTPPEGVTVYKYALMVSFEIKYSTTLPMIKITVDDETLVEMAIPSSSYTWHDRAKEVSVGTHNIKIYLSRNGGGFAYLRGTRGNCGIGTIGTMETKVAMIETVGDSKFSYVVAGKAYESPTTVTGIGKADESESDKVDLDVDVTADGAEYSNNAYLLALALQAYFLYGKTLDPNVVAFLTWVESRSLVAVTP